MRLNLPELAELMKHNPGKWMLLERRSDRNPLSTKSAAWKRRNPPAFRDGRYEFRTFKDRYAERPTFYLEGRYLNE